MIDYPTLIGLLNKAEAEDELRSRGYRYNAGTCFKLIYACYGRVCEVVRPRTVGAIHREIGLLKKSNVTVSDGLVRLDLKTEKQSVSRNNIHRVVWVSRVRQPDIYFSLVRLYDSTLGDDPFFDVSYRWVELKFKKFFPFVRRGENVHLLRHWAATHYLQGFHTVVGGVPSFNKLAAHGGWSSYDTLYRTYHHLSSEDYKKDY